MKIIWPKLAFLEIMYIVPGFYNKILAPSVIQPVFVINKIMKPWVLRWFG